MRIFPKDNEALRVMLIAVFSLLGFVLVIIGWKMTGQLIGLGLMIVGVALLLTAMGIYNDKYK